MSKRADMSADNKQGGGVADQTDDMIKSHYTSNTSYDHVKVQPAPPQPMELISPTNGAPGESQ